MMHHVMVDLETLGTTPRSPIISIGAVFFDPDTGKMGDTFHVAIFFKSACAGREIDADTIAWWFKQSSAARNKVLLGDSYMEEALSAFSDFLTPLDEKGNAITPVVWGNGSTFDISILEDVYRQRKLTCPWPYWSVRDVRTIVDCAEGIVSRKDFEFEGTEHNALDDAIHQAKYVAAMWQALRGEKK